MKDGVLLRKYELGRLLGQGTFAKVYYARNLKTGTSVAVKIIQKDKISKAGLIEQMKQEISIMKLMKHPNVIELYEVLASKSKIYLVMEYAKGGELFDLVAKGKLSEDMARMFFRQLVKTVSYCHSRGVCHRDLKLENLMIDEFGNLKVTDFGLSAVFAEVKRKDGLLHTTCGTPAYVAPEVIGKKGYDGAKADVWSCGVILYVLLAGYLPFRDMNLMELYRKIEKAEYKSPIGFSKDVNDLLARILDPNPNSRISLEKIEECSWFQNEVTSASRNVGTCLKFENLELGNVTIRNVNDEDVDSTIRPRKLNAFEIISLSSGLDLSGFFEDQSTKALRFTSVNTASYILEKICEFAEKEEMRIGINDKGVIRMERCEDGKKEGMWIDAEILEIAIDVYLIELKIANFDYTCEHQVRRDMMIGLKDIIDEQLQ